MGEQHTAEKVAGHGTTCDGCLMVAMVKRAEDAEGALDDALRERDEAQAWADRLAYAIAPVEAIGEHTSHNSPWENALNLAAACRVTPPRPAADTARARAARDTIEEDA